VMEYNHSYFQESCYFDGDLRRPVENVTVDECLVFMLRLGEMTG
jgi:hypothetical protein